MELDLIDKDEGFEPALIRRGFYLQQLEEYWKYFDKNQLMVIGFKEFIVDIKGVLSQVESFIGVPKYNWDQLVEEPRNKRSYHEPISKGDELFLKSSLNKPNKALFDEVGALNW